MSQPAISFHQAGIHYQAEILAFRTEDLPCEQGAAALYDCYFRQVRKKVARLLCPLSTSPLSKTPYRVTVISITSMGYVSWIGSDKLPGGHRLLLAA